MRVEVSVGDVRGQRLRTLRELSCERLAREVCSTLDLAFDQTSVCAALFDTTGEYIAPNDRHPASAQYETHGHPYYASTRLWDDNPTSTSGVLGLALSVCPNAPLAPRRKPVFRM